MTNNSEIISENITGQEFSQNIENNGYVVILENVKKDYNVKGRNVPVRALRGASMKVEKGSMVAVKGSSGSGKTTLLQMIGALDIPTSGEAIVNGKDISKMKEKDLTEHRAKTIGFVFQTFNLIPNLTALENVALPMEALNVPKIEREVRAFDLLKAVGMEERLDYHPLKLSGGEQQRVAIARALANNPSIILADEPTGSLDSKTGATIIKLMDELRKERDTTVIMVTHSNSAAKECDFTFTIKDGVITSKMNILEEDFIETQKNSLGAELAISGKKINKLFAAGYEDLDSLTKATFEDLANVLGDKKTAEKILEKVKILIMKKDAEREIQKKMLCIDLSVNKSTIDKLFFAGLDDMEKIGKATLEELTEILSNEETANQIAEKAELHILKEEKDD